MAKISTNLTDTINQWLTNHNALSNKVGDLTLLNTSVDSDLVGSINSLVTDLAVFAPLSALTVDSSGYLAIGTNDPQGPIHVIGTGGAVTNANHALTADIIIEDAVHASLQLSTNATDGIGSIYFGDSGNPNVGYLAYFHSNDTMMMHVGSTEHMRLRESEVIFGEVDRNPQTTIDAYRTTSAAGIQVMSRDAQADLFLNCDSAVQDRIFFGHGNDWDEASIKYTPSTNAMEFFTNARSTADVTINDGGVSIAGDVGLTAGASNWTFTVVSNNLVIKYGATSLAKLDTSGNLTVIGDINTNGTI